MEWQDDPRDWAGWKYDLRLKQIYADRLSSGLVALSPSVAADWLQSRGVTANKGALSNLAQQAWSWLTSRGFDQAIRGVVSQVLGDLWAEGFAVGRESAREQLSSAYDSAFWSAWTPGDAAAARLAAGPGLQQLLDDYGIQTIKSVTQTKMHDLADALAEGFEDGDSADTIAKSIEQILSSPQRALMVAGTELNRATTQASVAEYKKADQDGKVWSSAKDDRVCPHCKRNVEQGTIPIDQAYDTGDIFTPGHPECRCAILPKRLPADQSIVPRLSAIKSLLLDEYLSSGLSVQQFINAELTTKSAYQEEFEAGGLAVRAQDTGRVLMIQRAHDEDDPAGGKWEFPGGRLDPGESVEDAARREWAEETGLAVPAGQLAATWDDGNYRGHVLPVASESKVDILGRKLGTNPDDPANDEPEAIAWWDPDELKDNPAVRDELQEHPKRVRRALDAVRTYVTKVGPGGWSHGWIRGDAALETDRASGVAGVHEPRVPGSQGDVSFVKYGNGSAWAKKQFADSPDGKAMADREEAASLISHVVGAGAPRTVRTGPTETHSDYVPGRNAMDDALDDMSSGGGKYPSNKKALSHLADLHPDAAKRIGLLDTLIGNHDRSPRNVMVHEGTNRPVPIDHGTSWDPDDHSTSSPFKSSPGDFAPDELSGMESRLAALKPEFARIFGGTAQHDQTMAAWNAWRSAAKSAPTGTDVGEQVYQQLLKNYPPDSIEWVKDATWSGPHLVPWAEVDHDDMDKWAASHQRGKVDEFKRKIEAGEHVNPAVLVVDPDGDYIDVDGHHRALAYHELGKLIPAWIGDIEPQDRHDMEETHLDQVHEGADPKNKAIATKGWADAWLHELRGPHGEWISGGGLVDDALRAAPGERHDNQCHDGCGGITRGGKYLPGHDAKHVKRLHAEVTSGQTSHEDALRELGHSSKLQDKLNTRLGGPPKTEEKPKAPEIKPPPPKEDTKTAFHRAMYGNFSRSLGDTDLNAKQLRDWLATRPLGSVNDEDLAGLSSQAGLQLYTDRHAGDIQAATNEERSRRNNVKALLGELEDTDKTSDVMTLLRGQSDETLDDLDTFGIDPANHMSYGHMTLIRKEITRRRMAAEDRQRKAAQKDVAARTTLSWFGDGTDQELRDRISDADLKKLDKYLEAQRKSGSGEYDAAKHQRLKDTVQRRAEADKKAASMGRAGRVLGWQLEHDGSAQADEHLKQLNQAPSAVLRALKKNGTRIKLSGTTAGRADLGLSGPVRGPNNDAYNSRSWDDVGGVYIPTRKTAFAGDTRRSGSVSTVLHESSHALDHEQGYASRKPAYARIYKQAAAGVKLNPYYGAQQTQEANLSEFWAETLAAWMKFQGTSAWVAAEMAQAVSRGVYTDKDIEAFEALDQHYAAMMSKLEAKHGSD
jgi:SPP1 gp7 family putative phage head morphogenesis protein